MRCRHLLPLLALSLSSTIGCRFGEAAFTTDIDRLTFDPAGTAFSYLDEHDANLEVDTDPRVAVALTWIAFDPASDLSDKDGASLAQMAHEMELRDALSIVFSHQSAVEPEAELSVTKEGDDVVDGSNGGADLDFHIHFAPERLYADSSYEELVPLGSRRTLTITIDHAGFTDSVPLVAGAVSIDIEAVDGVDIGKAREGTITGTFFAPLVVERTAEKNLALLDAAANLDVLPLPLPARSAP
ncbi:MAG TPA: hypothetical protein VGF99_06375 [Myxococcota bacterium]